MRYKLNVRLQVLRLSLSDDGITYDGEHPIGNAIMRLPSKRRLLSVVTATSVSVNEGAVNEIVRYYTLANSGRTF